MTEARICYRCWKYKEVILLGIQDEVDSEKYSEEYVELGLIVAGSYARLGKLDLSAEYLRKALELYLKEKKDRSDLLAGFLYVIGLHCQYS